MTAFDWTDRPVAPAEAAILDHPDQRSTWAPAIRVQLAEPLRLADAQLRLDELAMRHSILGARLSEGRWISRGASAIREFDGNLAALCDRFDLEVESPLRVALAPDRLELAVVSHHAALDGRALVEVARWLIDGRGGSGGNGGGSGKSGSSGNGGEASGERQDSVAGATESGRSTPDGDEGIGERQDSVVRATEFGRSAPGGAGDDSAPGGGRLALLRRLALPADRVARSSRTGRPEGRDAFAEVEVPESRRLRVAPLAAASVEAVAAWNDERSERWKRVGLTIPVGGPDVLGNVSTHRRVDVRAGADVAAAVAVAIAESPPPPDGGSPLVARLLAPVIDRFSDSLLVSNLGLIDLPGAVAIDFFPQARGRSAVAIGASTVAGGARQLTLRARDLSDADARLLLARIVEDLPRG